MARNKIAQGDIVMIGGHVLVAQPLLDADDVNASLTTSPKRLPRRALIAARATTASTIRPARHAAEHPRSSQTCPPPSPTAQFAVADTSQRPGTQFLLI
jgi:hypothetical protein